MIPDGRPNQGDQQFEHIFGCSLSFGNGGSPVFGIDVADVLGKEPLMTVEVFGPTLTFSVDRFLKLFPDFRCAAKTEILINGARCPRLETLEEESAIDSSCAAGRPVCTSVVIMNWQSVKTTERGGVRGFDAHKHVKGRKRCILVDTSGLPIACRVEPANISDRRAASLLIGGLSPLSPAFAPLSLTLVTSVASSLDT